MLHVASRVRSCNSRRVIPMNPTVATAPQPPLTESQKAALLTLLADDDPNIHQIIRAKILSHGPAMRDWMRPHRLSSDAVLRRRAAEIVEHFDRESADNEFVAFCLTRGEDLDAELGAWLLAQTQYPAINTTAYQALLDSYAGDLKVRIDFGAPADQMLTTINQYLFAHLGFSGNEQNYFDPENSYLNCVLDRRRGNPISLCLVYIAIARRLRLPVAGVGLPGHFLCRFQSTRGDLYIDPFHRGRLLTRADCIKLLINTGHEFYEGYLSAVSPRKILLRMCSNLHHIYTRLEHSEESNRLHRYITALAK